MVVLCFRQTIIVRNRQNIQVTPELPDLKTKIHTNVWLLTTTGGNLFFHAFLSAAFCMKMDGNKFYVKMVPSTIAWFWSYHPIQDQVADAAGIERSWWLCPHHPSLIICILVLYFAERVFTRHCGIAVPMAELWSANRLVEETAAGAGIPSW